MKSCVVLDQFLSFQHSIKMFWPSLDAIFACREYRRDFATAEVFGVTVHVFHAPTVTIAWLEVWVRFFSRS
jgi:hypothetical protein